MLNEIFSSVFPEEAITVPAHTVVDLNGYLKKLTDGGFCQFNIGPASTQKARGIKFLLGNQEKVTKHFMTWKVPKHYLFEAGEEFANTSFNYPVFARPCPIVPRHGFVDSVVCHNAEELNKVSLTTKEVEPEAELLVASPINAAYNVILNGGVITFAPGNDGATSGKGCRYFYIDGDPIGDLLDVASHDLIAAGEVPFYELVLDSDNDAKSKGKPVCLVQVRSAPPTPKVKDFVPNPVKVVEVIKAEGDLLEWEERLRTVDPTTTIIDHMGGSLSSHYAIHAIVNKVPIFTSYLPEVGSLVEPTVVDTELNDADKEKFFNAFVLGFSKSGEIIDNVNLIKAHNTYSHNTWVMTNILKLGLATLHNFSQIAISKDYEILGLVLGLFSRVTFAVSAGETRYASMAGKEKKKFKSFFNFLLESGNCNGSRNQCYKNMMYRDTKSCIEDALTIYQIFDELSWGASYGGKKWANCTASAINLFNACVKREISEVVQLFNKVINEEHNGGKYLNKVIDIMDFNLAANNAADYTLQNLYQIVDLLYTSWSFEKTVSEADKELFQTIPLEKTKTAKVNVKETVDQSSKSTIYVNGMSKIVINPDQPYFKIQPYAPGGATHANTVSVMVNGEEMLVSLPELINTGLQCACCTCLPGQKYPLSSSPLWWTNHFGEKVISKVKLSKLINAFKAHQKVAEKTAIVATEVPAAASSNSEHNLAITGVATTGSTNTGYGYGMPKAINSASIGDLYKHKITVSKNKKMLTPQTQTIGQILVEIEKDVAKQE